MKMWIPVFACICIFFTTAFKSISIPNRLSETRKISPPRIVLDQKLYPLYYYNSNTNDSLKNVIDQVLNNTDIKIVFQFYFRSTGELSLCILTGKKNHKIFNETYYLKLTPLTSCNNAISIDGSQDVYLGDQEINKQDTVPVKRTLRTLYRDSKNKYLVFSPSFETDPVSAKVTVKYQIFIADEINDPKICDLTKDNHFLGITDTKLITNPSPPRKGNQ